MTNPLNFPLFDSNADADLWDKLNRISQAVNDWIASHLDSGQTTVTGIVANTPTSKRVNFHQTFSIPPNVQATANTSVPGTGVTGVGVTGVDETGFTLTVTRTNTTDTAVNWLAILTP